MAEETDYRALHGGSEMHGCGIDPDIVTSAFQDPGQLRPRGLASCSEDLIAEFGTEFLSLGNF